MPSGARPLIAIIGVATILVPGSLLGVFLDSLWLGAAVVIAFGAVAMAEGAYRLWNQTHQALSLAEGAKEATLPDRVRRLHEEGLAQRQSIAADPTWGTIHRQTPLSDWVDEVNRTLRHDAPHLAIWVHQMESPAPRLAGSSRDPKEMQLAAYDWLLNRLREVEAMLRADEPGGHPRRPRSHGELEPARTCHHAVSGERPAGAADTAPHGNDSSNGARRRFSRLYRPYRAS
jgi:hypothetical protein